MLVASAQRAAIETAQNGTITADVDRAARQVIKEAGYDQYFTHRLGHGVFYELILRTSVR